MECLTKKRTTCILIVLLSIILFSTNCHFTQNEKTLTLNLTELKEYKVGEEHTSILLLKSYILNKSCSKTDSHMYANAFLCSVFSTVDTVIVLNICEKASDFLQPNYSLKADNDLIIDSSKVSSKHPMQVIVNIDSNVVSKRYPYIVADITKLIY